MLTIMNKFRLTINNQALSRNHGEKHPSRNYAGLQELADLAAIGYMP